MLAVTAGRLAVSVRPWAPPRGTCAKCVCHAKWNASLLLFDRDCQRTTRLVRADAGPSATRRRGSVAGVWVVAAAPWAMFEPCEESCRSGDWRSRPHEDCGPGCPRTPLLPHGIARCLVSRQRTLRGLVTPQHCLDAALYRWGGGGGGFGGQ